ncbi:MAG: hypothetical protein JWM11_5834, partial [Planctomycetaceae bacterium]|nr:hypothetical protein [Planctomycetaceae bacterium]
MVRPDRANEWLLPQLVGDLKESGVKLQTGECYGYKLPPIVGGKMEPDNFEPTDLDV